MNGIGCEVNSVGSIFKSLAFRCVCSDACAMGPDDYFVAVGEDGITFVDSLIWACGGVCKRMSR